MSRKHARWAIVAGLALGLGGLIACSGDDTVPSKVQQGPQGGGQDATIAEGGGGGEDSALPPGAPLCHKYGADLPQKVTTSLMANVAADCRISAHFTAPAEGTPHLQQCLQKQLGTFFQCDGAKYDQDNAGKPCRSMGEAHAQLKLRSADFDAFIEASIKAMRDNGVSDKDIGDVVPTFLGTKTAIVKNQGLRGDSLCTCPNNIAPDGGYCGIPEAGIDAGDGGDGGKDGGTLTDASDDGG